MSRFSPLLFAVGFGLFTSLTTLTSCGDNTEDPIDKPTKEENVQQALKKPLKAILEFIK